MGKSYGRQVTRDSEMDGCDTVFPEDEERTRERALAVTAWGDLMGKDFKTTLNDIKFSGNYGNTTTPISRYCQVHKSRDTQHFVSHRRIRHHRIPRISFQFFMVA